MPSSERKTGTEIEVATERDAPHGWIFVVHVPAESGGGATRRSIEMTLSWVDYEFWSHGAASPSRVAEMVVRAVLASDPARVLPDRFDASTARRWARDLDRRVRELL